MNKKDQILQLFTEQVPQQFVKLVREEYDAAFFEAHRRANETGRTPDTHRYDLPERSSALGYERHWCTERALRRAAISSGLVTASKDTVPVGGRYTLAITGTVVIGRAKVDRFTGTIKPALFRTQLAQMNAAISPRQGNLFTPLPQPMKGSLFALIIAAANKHSPAEPAFVNLAIPNSDNTDWVLNLPLEEVIAAYHVEERPAEAIPDLAIVAFKKRVQE